MMAEYIERKNLVKKIRKVIAELPAADVVEVVRCKDCKHQEDCEKQIVFWKRNHVLEQNEYQYNKIDFCSYGERRSE